MGRGSAGVVIVTAGVIILAFEEEVINAEVNESADDEVDDDPLPEGTFAVTGRWGIGFRHKLIEKQVTRFVKRVFNR